MNTKQAAPLYRLTCNEHWPDANFDIEGEQ